MVLLFDYQILTIKLLYVNGINCGKLFYECEKTQSSLSSLSETFHVPLAIMLLWFQIKGAALPYKNAGSCNYYPYCQKASSKGSSLVCKIQLVTLQTWWMYFIQRDATIQYLFTFKSYIVLRGFFIPALIS